MTASTATTLHAPSAPVSVEQAKYYFSSSLVTLAGEDTPAMGAFAALRANLLSGHFRVGRRSLAVCSPTADAGSTFVAANTAFAIAQTGIKTLLIDANLANPGLEKYVMPPEPGLGLRQMLRGGDVAVDHVCPDVVPNLSILFAGGGGSNSSELIAGREFKSVLDELVRDHEFTIIDTPPGKRSPDAIRIATAVRYALVVARRDVSYLSDVQELVADLENAQTNVVGSFLTDF